MLSCLFAFLLAHGAPGATSGAFEYSDEGASVTITRYTGQDQAVVIPRSIEVPSVVGGQPATIAKPVAAIGKEAFLWNDTMTSISIPDSVTSIGNSAFAICRSLVEVTLPSSITTIEARAFASCSTLVRAHFLGNAPAIPGDLESADAGIFGQADPGFAVYYPLGAVGFSSPYWHGYVAQGGETMAPVVLAPTDQRAYAGTTVTLSVVVHGAPAPTLQWQKDGVAIARATEKTLVLANVQVSQAGSYRVVATNAEGTATSAAATVSIVPTVGEFTYSDDGPSVTITNYFGRPNGKVVIPGSVEVTTVVDGKTITTIKPVTAIGTQAFDWTVTMESVEIPDTVTSLGNGAFLFCMGLTSVTLPPHLSSLGDNAFFGCSGLTEVKIPAGVTSIGAGAFASASRLKSVQFLGNAPATVGDNPFGDPTAPLIVQYSAAATGFSTPLWRGYLAQCGDTMAPVVRLPTSPRNYDVRTGSTVFFEVTVYGTPAPSVQWRRDDVDIPGATGASLRLTEVQPWQAGRYSAVATNAGGSAVGEPGTLAVTPVSGAFTYLDAGTTLKITGYEGSDASVEIPNTIDVTVLVDGQLVTVAKPVTAIARQAFSRDNRLTSVTIPASVAVIEDYAFDRCEALTSARFLGEPPTVCSERAFSTTGTGFTVYFRPGTAGFTTPYWKGYLAQDGDKMQPAIPTNPQDRRVEIGETATFTAPAYGIPAPTLQWQKDGMDLPGANAATLEISNVQPEHIGAYRLVATNSEGKATSGTATLAVYRTSGNIKYVDYGSFLEVAGCVDSGITGTLTIPSAVEVPTIVDGKTGTVAKPVTRIGVNAFSNCDGLTEVVIPDSITSIGKYAFHFCNSLAKMTIPASVQTIGDEAFDGCYNLGVARFRGDAPSNVGRRVFFETVIYFQPGAKGFTFPLWKGFSSQFDDEGPILPPAFVWSPRNTSAHPGDYITLTVAATGNPAPTIQWQKDGVAIPGATSTTLWFYPVEPGQAGRYRAVATSSAGSATSPSATLRVHTGPEVLPVSNSVGVVHGESAAFHAEAAGATSWQWYKGGRAIAATAETLTLQSVAPSDVGIYDCLANGPGGETLTTPIVVGLVPAQGERMAGSVTTRPEWQNIQHPNGAVYDQFLLSGTAGTFTADRDQIARMSFLDENESIVQVEMSGAGAITVVLDPSTATGPIAPSLYNQSGIAYMKGKASIILSGADGTTHFTIYSVGTANNPAVTRADVPYAAWADVAVAGVVTEYGWLGGIHQGNVRYSNTRGLTGLYAPGVSEVGSLVVIHGIEAANSALPYLHFDPYGLVEVKVAGSSLFQPNGETITVAGVAHIAMGAGQDSCGRSAPAQPIHASLFDPEGRDVTAAVTTGP
ncbi:MAG: leucine-rich repeat protein [Opitutaceae bacterium]|nr:leucine-rich repeat protein [Opitutaceae bacterium]